MFLIQKCLSSQQARKPVCQRLRLSLNTCYRESTTKQGQALQINQASLKHMHPQTGQTCWVGYRFLFFLFTFLFFFLPCRSLKSARFYSASEGFFFLTLFLFFLMEKEERKMKSIFNVYRGAQPNSLQSAETILNKLIFNEILFV